MSDLHGTGTRPHVVVLGGGFGGLAAVRALRKEDVDVTLVDRHPYNTFQPLLYQVATATLNPGDVTWFLRSARSKQENVRFVQGVCDAVDHDARTLRLSGGEALTFDHLVIATGVAANFFGTPGAEQFAMPLYTRNQALAVRDAVFSGLEEAAASRHHDSIRVVVVGGGPTGVETAGALAETRSAGSDGAGGASAREGDADHRALVVLRLSDRGDTGSQALRLCERVAFEADAVPRVALARFGGSCRAPRVPATSLASDRHERDAVHRARCRAEIAGHTAFFSIRVAAQDDTPAPAWRNNRFFVRILNRHAGPEHMQKDDPHCFQGIPHVIFLLFSSRHGHRGIFIIPTPIRLPP